MFAYCANDPINCVDSSGLFWSELWSGFKSVVRTALHIGNSVIKAFGVDTAGIGAYWLNMSKDSKGIYHANFDCWQSWFGYNDFYDFMFGIGTNMISQKYQFTYNKRNYILWAWKGDYINLGAGAELGIYFGGPNHWFVNKKLASKITMKVTYNKMTIISHQDYTWWITGFNGRLTNFNISKLKATFVFKFNSRAMYNAFINTCGNKRFSRAGQNSIRISF